MTAGHVLVAPRELDDLVYRCARIAGVEAGWASTIARSWTEAALAVAGTDRARAVRSGLPLAPLAFNSLCEAAAGFLVSEQALDDLDS